MKIGVDLDDTLSETRQLILKFHNDTYGTSLEMKDIKSYNFWEVWGGTRAEAIQKIEDFFKTSYFSDIEPKEGAKDVLKKLKKNNELYVITARGDNMKKETEEWVEKYFPRIFSGIYLTNKFSDDGKGTTKEKVCDKLGIDIFIEDDIENVLECARQNSRKIYLFDYPWNQDDKLPKNVIRIHSWKEIEKLVCRN